MNYFALVCLTKSLLTTEVYCYSVKNVKEKVRHMKTFCKTLLYVQCITSVKRINVLFSLLITNNPALRRIMIVFSCTILSICCFLSQLIQTISAVDTDEPLGGHKFVFSISATNPNFTIIDKEGRIKFSSQYTGTKHSNSNSLLFFLGGMTRHLLLSEIILLGIFL